MRLSTRLQLESLQEELAQCQEDYQAVDEKYLRENHPVTKKNLQREKEDIIRHIQELEKRQEEVLQEAEELGIQKLITLLQREYENNLEIIHSAYRRSLPRRLIGQRQIPSELNLLIIELNKFPQGDSDYKPLEKFVGNLLLTESLPSPFSISLRDWAEIHIQELQELLNQLSEVSQQLYPGLLVYVSQCQDRSYIVSAWLIENIQNYGSSLGSNHHPLTHEKQKEIYIDAKLENLPNLLRSFINQGLDYCDSSLQEIHLFLPQSLMNCCADCWSSDEEDDELASTLGADYKVIVRCSERVEGRSPEIMKWRQKGRLMKDKLNESAESIFLSGDDRNLRQLLARLKRDDALALKLTNAPQTTPQQSINVFKVFLKAAIPLAIWFRQNYSCLNNCLSELDDLLTNCPLQQLPEQVKSKRLDAFETDDSNHLGKHISLLWDDPDLVPPTQQLTQNKL